MNMHSNTRQALADFLTSSQKSQKQVSKELGLSSAVVSQFLKGIYPGDNEEISITIDKYLALATQRLSSTKELPFVQNLYNTQEVLFACKHAHLYSDMALVCGSAGAGKTTALRFYAENNTNVLLVTANSCAKTATEVLKMICQKLFRQVPSRKAAMMRMLVDKLSGTNGLLIIDEADHLTLDALQAVRNLNDEAKMGIVLAGNDKIYNQMISPRRGNEFDQIRSRFGVRKRVCSEFTAEEIQELFPGCNDGCLSYLLQLSSRESLRTARKLYRIALELAEETGKELMVKHLKAVSKDLFGGM